MVRNVKRHESKTNHVSNEGIEGVESVESSDRRSLFVFLLIVTLFAACGYVVALRADGSHQASGILIVQFAPMVAAFISSLIHSRSLRGFGWGLGRWRYLGVALVLPFVLGIISFSIIWGFGFGTLDPSEFIAEAQAGINDMFGLRLTSDAVTLGLVVFLNGTLGLFVAFGAVGEELGWRGFLAPKMMKLTGFTTTSVVVGSLWAFYHYPLIIWIVAPALDVLVWPLLLSYLGACIGLTVIMNWLRFKSGSVWVAVIFHMSLNIHTQGFFQAMTVNTSEYSNYLSGEFGCVFALICVVAGFGFWRMRDALGR